MRKLKRAVIKEELVVLTGHHLSALVLQQFLYWSERTSDFDKFIEEERERDPDLAIELTSGWIYKSAKEMLSEVMVSTSEETIRRHIQKLVEKDWLGKRRNPKYGWDKTLQYRPDIHVIQGDLQRLGYALEGYPLQLVESIPQGVESKPQGVESIPPGVEALSEIIPEIIPDIWVSILSELKLQTRNPETLERLAALRFVSHDGDGAIILAASDEYTRRWVEDRLLAQIERAAAGVEGRPVRVEWEG